MTAEMKDKGQGGDKCSGERHTRRREAGSEARGKWSWMKEIIDAGKNLFFYQKNSQRGETHIEFRRTKQISRPKIMQDTRVVRTRGGKKQLVK